MAAKGTRAGTFRAFGSLDQRTRHWQKLPPVSARSGETPRGDELVYQSNGTTLEVGQGASTFRGFVGFAMSGFLAAGVWLLFGVIGPILLAGGFGSVEAQGGWTIVVAGSIILPFFVLALFFAASVVATDFFGYVDLPLRFDRVRRKVYVWSARAAGPLVLDWDTITPIAQSASAPPYQFNAFRSVLLVDLDPSGEVRFEGRVPRIAQIGAAVLDRGHTIAAYEFVRVFMEQGPAALPPVHERIAWRPGMRSWVDIFGFLKGSIRGWPDRPPAERKVGWLVAGIVAMTLTAPMFWPLQLSQAIALRTTRIPRWPAAYERMASEGGPLTAPPGSRPNDAPLLPHELAVGLLWVASAFCTYAWIASKLAG